VSRVENKIVIAQLQASAPRVRALLRLELKYVPSHSHPFRQCPI